MLVAIFCSWAALCHTAPCSHPGIPKIMPHPIFRASLGHMSYSLNSLKVSYIGGFTGEYYGAYEGDTRNLDYSSSGLGKYAQHVSSSEANMPGFVCQDGEGMGEIILTAVLMESVRVGPLSCAFKPTPPPPLPPKKDT